MRIFFSLLFLTTLAFAQPPKGNERAGFEFRGLKTGITEAQAISALSNHSEESQLAQRVDCLSRKDERFCAIGNYAALINRSGLVWSINYSFESSGNETVAGFVKALEKKYGKPVSGNRSYMNGLGAEFSGSEHIWKRGTQILTVEEVCGEIGKHCVKIIDTSLGHLPDPKI